MDPNTAEYKATPKKMKTAKSSHTVMIQIFSITFEGGML
jgi:hypothetical protein